MSAKSFFRGLLVTFVLVISCSAHGQSAKGKMSTTSPGVVDISSKNSGQTRVATELNPSLTNMAKNRKGNKQIIPVAVQRQQQGSANFGPCDISQLTNTGNSVKGHQNTGQSFTATCTGNIYAIEVYYNGLPGAFGNTNDRVLNIRDGGLPTSPIIHTQVIPYASIVVGLNTFTLTVPVAINNGEVNAWEISDAGNTAGAADGVSFNFADPYAGGGAWYSSDPLGGGSDITFNVIVTPTCTAPVTSATPASQTICSGSAITPIVLTSTLGGTTYSWTRDNVVVTGIPASGTASTISGSLTNPTNIPITVTFTITPTAAGCTGTPVTATVTVNPTPTVTATPASQTICSDAAITPVVINGNIISGGMYACNGGTGAGAANPGALMSVNSVTAASTVLGTPIPGASMTGIGFVGSTLYGFKVVNSTPAELITINPATGALISNIGAVTLGGTPINLTDMAIQPGTNIIYGTTGTFNGASNRLVTINAATAVATLIGQPVPSSSYLSIAFGPDGTLYGLQTNQVSGLLTINPNTGAVLTNTPLSILIGAVGLGFDPASGFVYASECCQVGLGNNLYRIDPATGATTAIGSFGSGIRVQDLAFLEGYVTYNWTRDNPAVTGIAMSGSGTSISGTLTNPTNSPITVTFTITPTYTNAGVTCTGTPVTATVLVNATPIVNAVSNQLLCNGNPTAPVNFSSPTNTGTLCATANENGNVVITAPPGAVITGVNFASYGTPTGSCGSFAIGTCHATNSLAIVSALAIGQNSVTIPATNGRFGDPCGGTVKRLYVEVTYGAIEYNWTNNTPSIGLAASGTGNIASFNAVNNTNVPLTATITVTPGYSNGGVTCTGTPTSFTITVNPTPTVNAVANQVVCNGAPTAAVNFTGAVTAPPGTVFNWTNNNTSIGLAASGSGDIASFTAVNTGTSPVTATITVTPSYTNAGTTCTGTPITFTITVNPTATVTLPANAYVCNGDVQNTGTYNFSTTATGGTTTYSWVNDNITIGLGGSGTGNSLPAFTATNTGIAPITGTITVTPTFTNGGVSCVGTPSSFSITVNPTPNVTATPASQTICSATAITTIVNTGTVPGTVFNWVRDNTVAATGIAASGTGDISGTLTNTTNGPVLVSFIITPGYTNGGTTCFGTPVTATVLVNPRPVIDPVANQIVCNGDLTAPVNFTSPTTGGTIVYNWTNSLPSIGLAASGSGNIAAFTAINTSNAAVTATITVTPTYTNGGISCAGTPVSFTITVNPTPQVDQPASQVVCNGASTAPVNFTGPVAGTVFNWTNSNPAIGLAASGTGNIPSFIGTNPGIVPITGIITVTPVTPLTVITSTLDASDAILNSRIFRDGNPGTCPGPKAWPGIFGTAGTYYYETYSLNNQSASPVCVTTTLTSTTTNQAHVMAYLGSFDPANQAANFLSDCGSSTTGSAVNMDFTAPANSSIVFVVVEPQSGQVCPSYTLSVNGLSGCTGPTKTFTYTVNPTPTVDAVANQIVCAGSPTAPVNFTGAVAGTVYNWTNNNPNIGLANSGSGDIPSFIAVNAGAPPDVATIVVTPTYTNGGVTCTGTPTSFTITVNPQGEVSQPASQAVCNGAPTAPVNFTTAVPGTVFDWTNSNTTIGLAASGSGNIPSFIGTNATNAPNVGTITVTPTYVPVAPATVTFNYTGALQTFTVPAGVTSLNIDARGAQGGSVTVSCAATGGLGARMQGDFAVTPGEVISIMVGQQGFSNGQDAGGGGGTFVVRGAATPLIVAGGGGGASNDINNCGGGANRNGINASITTSGTASGNGLVAGGTAGNGGGASSGSGGGGGGFFTDGVAGLGLPGNNGKSYLNGGAGGNGNDNDFGGYGGGGAGWFTGGNGGGGGGYSGGGTDGNQPYSGGGGGGSYNTGTSQVNTAGIQTGNGQVVITYGGSAGPSCPGTPKTFTITVNPTPVVNAVASQVVCNGSPTAGINFTSPTTGGIKTYNWTNSLPSIGIPASGSGNIASFIATNPTNAPVTANLTVTMTYVNAGATCTSAPVSFTITVNPTPQVNQPASQTLCAGTPTAPVNFGGPVAGTIYNWTNNNTSIGLAASGSGNIASFIALNATALPVVATIIVTPVYSNAGTTCTGTSKTFTITVNPIPTVTPQSNRIFCNGATTPTITFAGTSGSTYSWTNSNTGIGLAASGTGDIAPFVTTNATNGPITATITVTPASGGCVGTPISFTITVNPTPVVNPVTSQVLCNGALTAAVNFTSPTTGPTGSLVFHWTNSAPSIGLAANGINSIPPFVAVNTGLSPVIALITVTPVYTNGGITCTGASQTFSITVNPTPTVNAVANQVLCVGAATAPVNFTGGVFGTIYNWTNSNPAIGLAAAGAGNIASFIPVNTGTTPVVATITVTPNYTNTVTCAGTPITFTITVNPVPSVNAVANQTVCSGATVTQAFSGPVSGTVYNWTNSNPAIGLGASGTGNLNFTATNSSNAALTGTITVTPVYTNSGGTCSGTPVTFTITVNPVPTVNAVLPQVLCNGATTAVVNFTGAVSGTVYNWTNSNTTIGLAASGTGNIASFVAANATAVVQTATITVTPTYTNGGATCSGTPTSFTITVNPTPSVNTIANQTVCNATATTAVTIAGPVAGTVYNWTNNNTSIGLGASGTNTIPSFLGVNTGSTPVTATITVTPTYSNGGISCTGASSTFSITVNPTAVVNQPANQLLCNGANTAAVVFSGLPPGSTYSWTNSNTAIGLAASGTGNIAGFVATNGTAAPITATITVTPTSTGCGGLPVSFSITVNPTPSVNAIANQTLCAGAITAPVTVSGPVAGTVYSWTNSNTTIGLDASGTGDIPAFMTVNPTINPVTATITVTPTYTNGGLSCTGPTRSFTITVNPLPNIVFIDMPQRACLTDTIITLKTNLSGGTWSGPGVSGNSFSAAVAGVGVHRLTYTVSNGFGCTTQRFTNMVVNDCIERHNVFQQAIRIWPNPNNGRFSLQFNSDKYKEFKVKVVNAGGQEMGYYEFKNLVYGQILPFDLSRVAAGMYYIYVYNTQESGVFPIVIQR